MRRKILSLFTAITMLMSLVPSLTITASSEESSATGTDIKLGDYVRMGTYDTDGDGTAEPILWRCVAFEKATGDVIDSTDTVTEYKDGYMPLMLADVSICKKVFDARNAEATGSHIRDSDTRKRYGSNYWGDSNIRDWLNSSAEAGDVTWSCGNVPPYVGEAGFLMNFNTEEKAAAKAVTQKSILSMYDKDIDGATGSELHTYKEDISEIVQNYADACFEQITDKMFLLDVQQLYNVYSNDSLLGNKSYYKPDRVYYWLRSPAASEHGCTVRTVYTDAANKHIVPGYDAGIYYHGIRPAFFLNPHSMLKGSGTEDTPYTIHNHIMTYHDKVPATLTKNGTVEYWECSDCEKKFADADGAEEITDTVILAGIQFGDYVQMGTYTIEALSSTAPILWRCVAFERVTGYDADNNPIIDSTDTKKEHQAGYMPLMLADKVVCGKEFDGSGGVTTGSHGRDGRNSYGSNYWGDSNIRDWLNSADNTVNYTCGNSPTYASEAGFLTNFRSIEKTAIKAVTQKSILAVPDKDIAGASGSELHTSVDNIEEVVQNYDKAYSEQITDKMFLLDVQQVKTVYDNYGDYYKPDNTSYYNKVYCLRTPLSGNNNYIRRIDEGGGFSNYSANGGNSGVRPAFFFNPQSVEYIDNGSGTESEPYVLHEHTLTHHDKVDAKCTETGTDEYWKCEGDGGCNKMFSDEDGTTEITEIPTIAMLGHKYGKWELTLTETSTEVIRTCANDNSHKEKRNAEIKLLIDAENPYIYSGEECKPKASVKVFTGETAVTLTEGTDYTLSYENNINAGTATVTITGKGDYGGTAQRAFNIGAKTINATAATAQNRAYDGTKTVTVTGVTLDGVCNGDTAAVDTDNLKGTIENADAGDYNKVTLQNLTLKNNENKNYILKQANVTVNTTVKINKADVPALKDGTPLNIANNLEKEYSYLLSRLCPQINEEGASVQKNWGERSYEIAGVVFDEDGYYDNNTARIGTVESGGTVNNTIYLPVKSKDTETTGKVGTVKIRVTSKNYKTFENKFEVHASNKKAVDFGGITAQDGVYNGKPHAGYTGTLTVTDSDNKPVTLTPEIFYSGRLNTGYTEQANAPKNAGTYSVIFRVAGTDENYIGKRTVNFEIKRADGSGSVTMADFIFGEEPSVPVPQSDTNGTDHVTYEYKTQGAADSEYKSEKPIKAGNYTVKATFAQTTNYNSVTATADFTINHDYSDKWSHDAANHWHECSCGSRTDEAMHIWNEGTVTQTVTCMLEGRTRFACTVCGREKIETAAALGHRWGAWRITIEPTLTTTGTAEHICERNNTHKETVTLPVLTDTTVWTPGTKVDPTDDDDGSQEYESEYGDVTITLPKPSPSPTSIPIVIPTATPTASPTATPTASPSATPTVSPTVTPTVSPTVTPTASPKPTEKSKHSSILSGKTTPKPTQAPTAEPDSSPKPTGNPQVSEKQHKAYVVGFEQMFRPNDSITRAEASAILARLTDGFDENGSYTSAFPDIAVGAWYANYIGFEENKNVIVGYPDGTFKPEISITRAEFASMITHFAKPDSSNADIPFTDTDGHWALDMISSCYEAGYIEGYEDNTFRPDEFITRAEAVAIINRVLGRSDIKEFKNPFNDVTENHWAYMDIMEAAITHNAGK